MLYKESGGYKTTYEGPISSQTISALLFYQNTEKVRSVWLCSIDYCTCHEPWKVWVLKFNLLMVYIPTFFRKLLYTNGVIIMCHSMINSAILFSIIIRYLISVLVLLTFLCLVFYITCMFVHGASFHCINFTFSFHTLFYSFHW